MDEFVVGPYKIITLNPTKYDHCVAVQVVDKFVVFEKKRLPVLVITKC
jgi:hypothetical protein